ncbi:ABC transporter substrate-binding protein [Manganibacter manganicus]|uniref:ABC transporter substrate-binding protein n=1 Tax=Manganibacter manganicus TaxID=1873176 RepID=UPI0013019F02|nr:extracellular solute-binding protein [Pseudaminobacter manganicus]
MLTSAALSGASAEEAPAVCSSPSEVQGFKTCADIAKAEQEGELVFYATDVEHGTVKVLGEFEKLFPKIKTSYIRLQAGALYARLMSERQGGSHLADVFQIGDMGLVLDFQSKGGYAPYVSPELSAYKPEYLSEPKGYWTWAVLMPAGMAYNPKVVSAAEAPKDWADALDPKWHGSVSMKSANSGMQHVTWYELNKLDDTFWDKMAEQQPRAFDSMVQQFDRLVNGDDKIGLTAQYAAYLEFKNKGAPIAFVAPTSGLPSSPEVVGVVNTAPHPNAARLFLDWYLSKSGQQASVKYWFFHSPREDVAPPEGALPITKMHLLWPQDWIDFAKSRPQFLRDMRSMTGMK